MLRFTLAIIGLLLSAYAQAQTNLTFTSPNSTTPGTFNVVLNPQPGPSLTMTGANNVFTGSQAGYSNQSGDWNTISGYQAGYSNTTGQFNTFTGGASGYNSTTASYNTFTGYGAGGGNISGTGNTYTGTGAGELNDSGELNVFTGYLAGRSNKTGSYNVAYGTTSSFSNVSGSNNAAFGHNAGNRNVGTYNTFLGSDSDVRHGTNLPAITYSTAIGANARVSISNALVLGDSVTGTKVGIGVTAPMFALDVKGVINLRDKGTIKFSSLTNPNLINGTTDQFLTTNANGETVLAGYRMTIASPEQWSDTVFSPAYRLKPLAEVEQFINAHRHLPGIPSAEEVVKSGVDPATITAQLLEKIEEITLYLIEVKKENKALRQLIESRLPDKK